MAYFIQTIEHGGCAFGQGDLVPEGAKIVTIDQWHAAIEEARKPKPMEPTPENLTAYAANKRWQVETGGIEIGGMQISTDRESQSMISSAFQVVNVTGQSIRFKAGNGFVELTPEQMQGIALSVAAHVQASFAAEADVIAAITAGEIASKAEIDTYAWPGVVA